MGYFVSIQDGLLVYGMGCSFRGWGVIRDGVLVERWGVSLPDGMFVYRMRC